MSKLDDFKAVVVTATDELRATINAAGDVLAGGDPPPPGVSPDGTEVRTVGPTIRDGNNHVWSLSAETGMPSWPDNKVLKDGVWAYGGGAQLITIKTGVVYVLNTNMAWWKDTGSGWEGQSSGPFPQE